MCPTLFITGHCGDSTSDGPTQVGAIPLQTPPDDYRAAICHQHATDLEPCWWRWWSGAMVCVIEWGRGRIWNRRRERERKMKVCVCVCVSEQELLFPLNPSYWILAVGIHHSPPLCHSGIGCKTLIKAADDTQTARECLCDFRIRSINLAADGYITIRPTFSYTYSMWRWVGRHLSWICGRLWGGTRVEPNQLRVTAAAWAEPLPHRSDSQWPPHTGWNRPAAVSAPPRGNWNIHLVNWTDLWYKRRQTHFQRVTSTHSSNSEPTWSLCKPTELGFFSWRQIQAEQFVKLILKIDFAT